MITLEGLTKCYGETRAVDALDLTVSPAQATGCVQYGVQAVAS